MNPANPASSDKAYLRDFFTERRGQLAEDTARKEALDMEIQTRLLISAEYRASETVLVYFARPFEIATSMIIYAALANHKAVGLPVTTEDHRMVFRRITSLRELQPGRFGILEPKDSREEIFPDEKTLCVCPALCCDMQGFRLGFGGGYYDRYLADFPGVKAALCYSDSLIPSMEHDAFDIPMDVLHTDNFSRYMKA